MKVAMKSWSRLAILLAVLIAAAGSARLLLGGQWFHLAALEARFGHLGPWAAVAFSATVALANMLLLPAWPFTVAAGVLFGPKVGLLALLPGAWVGSLAAFWLGRTALREIVEGRLRGRLLEFDQGLRAGGFRFVLLVRFVPILPHAVMSYALGATAVRPGAYFLATVLAGLPAAILLSFAGAAGIKRDLPTLGLALVGVLALAVVAAVMTRRTVRRRA